MLLALGALSLGYLGAAVLLDRHGRRALPAAAYDAIVVLGCRVYEDGRPRASLARRARRAAALWHEGRAPRVILTGGLGRAPISEARAAARVIEALGIPPEVVLLEERSTSTEENAREAAALLEGARVLVVTDAYHVFRAERVFRRHFADAVGAGSIGPARARVTGALREVVAIGAYALRGRL